MTDGTDIRERLVRIETKLDVALSTDTDHEKRLRSAERERWLHRGGLAVIALMAAKLGIPWPN
jgi:hypothetical protein